MSQQSKARPWRLFGKLLAVLVAFGLGVLALAALNSSLPNGPVHLSHGDAGWEGGGSGGLFNLEANFGKINASNQTAMSSSGMSQGFDGYACRTLAILGRSNHLLMQRIGPLLQQKLREMKHVERIDYYPPGHELPRAVRGPDLLVDLDLEKATTSGLATRRLEAVLRVGFGNDLNRCRSNYSDRESPPLARQSSELEVTHDSTTAGVGTPSSKFKLAAENLAEQIAQQIIGRHDDLLEEHRKLPDLPPAFYPDYEPTPEIALGETATQIASQSGLVTPNETLWRVDLEGTLAEWLNGLDAQLADAGWKREGLETTRNMIPHLRMTRGDETLTAYQVTSGIDSSSEAAEPVVGEVHYAKRLSRADQQAAYALLLTDETPTELLVLAAEKSRGDQRRRARDVLAHRPKLSPEGWLMLARLQQGEDKTAAVECLRNAKALLWMTRQVGDLGTDIRSLAKRIDPKLEQEFRDTKVPSEERLIELGVRRLDPSQLPEESEVGVGETLSYCCQSREERKDATFRVLTLTFDEEGVRYLNRTEGSYGSGSAYSGVTIHPQVAIDIDPLRDDTGVLSMPRRWRVSYRIVGK